MNILTLVDLVLDGHIVQMLTNMDALYEQQS